MSILLHYRSYYYYYIIMRRKKTCLREETGDDDIQTHTHDDDMRLQRVKVMATLPVK